ncbi:MAG: carbohydrate ABC transporter permease [Sphaerochaetaceae bacterium]|nr:carbohydrate ABC transporter permease [Sphaerochaetaceae bacterium]MDD3365951.1 carbohydrate ABC transporter permease [Sphaerochaetaceae bacterium]MDD4219639.1 carbohydrate ABC transporter permease [Sphaerochaetaceae bacterium]MDY0372074.1 carbohydrate ABC transporter permease [Sphaerochaetaceae bacterium]
MLGQSKITKNHIFTIIRHLFIIITCILVIFPLFWMVSTSFKAPSELFTKDLRLIPHNPSLINYKNVFSEWPVFRWILNSAIIALGMTLGRVLTSILAGFGFGYFKFRGKTLAFLLVLWSMSIPFMTTMIPNYIMVSKLGLLNSHTGVILPMLGYGFGIFFIRQHVMSIPPSLFDAAYLDGSNSWQILWRIVVPVIKGSLLALTVLIALEAWNIFFWPLLVLTRDTMHTLPIGLTAFQDAEAGTFWGELMAASTIASIPMVALYIATRTYLIEASITTGLK